MSWELDCDWDFGWGKTGRDEVRGVSDDSISQGWGVVDCGKPIGCRLAIGADTHLVEGFRSKILSMDGTDGGWS